MQDDEDALRKALQKAVEEENYEKAAELRDRLKKLHTKSSPTA